MESRPFPSEDRESRIGVFPTAANPFHWAHLLGGLITMERFLLDKVIFVIAGQDSRKPEMASEDVRHSMTKEVLALFQPFFEYSSIALGTPTSGEENLFSILRMNPAQAIHAFYIAGGDHYYRFHPVTGSPDTIQKLEDGMSSKLFGFDGQLHRVSAVFQPPAWVMSRSVLARLTPLPKAVPFAARQQALAVHPGQPLSAETEATLRRSPPSSVPQVRVLRPGYQKKVQGERLRCLKGRVGGSQRPSGGFPRESVTEPSASPWHPPAQGGMPRQPVGSPGRRQVDREPPGEQPITPMPSRAPQISRPPAPVPAAPPWQPFSEGRNR
jgi:hypothetical protein